MVVWCILVDDLWLQVFGVIAEAVPISIGLDVNDQARLAPSVIFY